jgi:hypothetical protein
VKCKYGYQGTDFLGPRIFKLKGELLTNFLMADLNEKIKDISLAKLNNIWDSN